MSANDGAYRRYTPQVHEDRILMKHGAGGRAMRRLIEETFAAGFADMPFDGVGLSAFDDGAAIRVGDDWLVITTDSHVVQPTFFPGGDIGRLSFAGTVNDLAMMGVHTPLALTCAVVLEEGYPRGDLERIHRSMVETSREAGVSIVTGDTKVMGHGELDGIVLNTTGIGLTKTLFRDNGVRAGDKIIVTGTIADHGIALMAARRNFGLQAELRSDVAPLNGLVRRIFDADLEAAVHAMKDPTRGGLASSLHEMAEKAQAGIVLEEAAIPMKDNVRATAEILGLDPLHIANEGKAVLAVRPDRADAVHAALRAHPLGRDARIIGTAVAENPGRVILDTGFGRRLIAEPEGDPLPRIC